jgi:2'-5' RNA ligase
VGARGDAEAGARGAPGADAVVDRGAGRAPSRRLFLALWPDEVMRGELARATRKAVRGSGGRPVPVESLHLTLAFLGSVPESRVPPLGALAGKVAGELAGADRPLSILLDRLEHWRAAQLLCVLPAEPPASVSVLARELKRRLTESGFAPDLKPFRPHVTVARKVMRPPRSPAICPVRWRFTELALIESRTEPSGALYSVVESYPLSTQANAAK